MLKDKHNKKFDVLLRKKGEIRNSSKLSAISNCKNVFNLSIHPLTDVQLEGTRLRDKI